MFWKDQATARSCRDRSVEISGIIMGDTTMRSGWREEEMQKRKLGNGDLKVSATGLGCMGFSHGYGPGPSADEAIHLIRNAFDLGCTFFDTAEGYAAGENERLVGRALAPIRNEVVLATKFHMAGPMSRAQFDKEMRAHLDASLERLGTDHVELYYQHRDPRITQDQADRGESRRCQRRTDQRGIRAD